MDAPEHGEYDKQKARTCKVFELPQFRQLRNEFASWIDDRNQLAENIQGLLAPHPHAASPKQLLECNRTVACKSFQAFQYPNACAMLRQTTPPPGPFPAKIPMLGRGHPIALAAKSKQWLALKLRSSWFSGNCLKYSW